MIVPDVEVLFVFLDNRKKIGNGYRPAHKVKDNYLTTGLHQYYDVSTDNGAVKGVITFISPEAYPACLWIGKTIEMYEGSHLIGYATVLQIFNSILEI